MSIGILHEDQANVFRASRARTHALPPPPVHLHTFTGSMRTQPPGACSRVMTPGIHHQSITQIANTGSVENTRTALHFATSAKKVTMRPQLNEVRDEQVRRRGGQGGGGRCPGQFGGWGGPRQVAAVLCSPGTWRQGGRGAWAAPMCCNWCDVVQTRHRLPILVHDAVSRRCNC